MKVDSGNSASSTGTTSSSGGASPPPGPFSEAEFLARQQEAAKRAISNVITQLTHDIGEGLDPRGWTKEHPWMMLAGATVAGFVGAVMAVPSKQEQALRRLARLEKALMPKTKAEPKAAADGKHVEEEDSGAKSYAKGHTSFLGGLGRQVLEAVKPAILSALTAGITAKASQPQPPPAQPPPPNPSGGYAAAQTGAATDPSAAI